jgi:hypothetical protein
MGYVARMGRALGRPRSVWEEIIRMELQEISLDGTERINMNQDRDQWRKLMNTVMKFRVT